MNYTKHLIREALKEDIGKKDITTQFIIPKNKYIKAILLAKEDCVVCGLKVARLVFKIKDKNIKFKPLISEGQKIKKGRIIARLQGQARPILTAERVALNFLGHLCGIATKTRKYAQAVKPYKIKIMDTRKTTPGLRNLEKYAVRVGGGYNHRFRLDEMLLVKDNHLKVMQGYKKLPKIAGDYKFEAEVKNLKEFRQALKLKPDIIMLDNMSIKDMSRAVQIKDSLSKAPKLEASGGIMLKNIRRIASTGIDMISLGALTHSVNSIDISLEVL